MVTMKNFNSRPLLATLGVPLLGLVCAVWFRWSPYVKQSLSTTGPLAGICCLLVAGYVCFEISKFIRERRKLHAVFKMGNVPTIGKPNLFSGNMFQTVGNDYSLKILQEFHARHGKTYGFHYGPDPWVMTTDLTLIKRLFITEGSVHVDVTQYRLPFLREFNESLAQVRGNKWRKTRKIMGPCFTQHQLKSDNVHRDVARVCDMFVEFIRAHARPIADKNPLDESAVSASNPMESKKANGGAQSAGEDGKFIIVDVHDAFKRFTMEIIFRLAFGCVRQQQLLPQESDPLIECFKQASEMLSNPFVYVSIMFSSLSRIIGFLSTLTPLGTHIRRVHAVVKHQLATRRKKLAEKAADDRSAATDGAAERSSQLKMERKMIDTLIESFELGKMDDGMLTANLFFFLLAGYETTSNALTMICYLLAKHPHIQDRLRNAILASSNGQPEYLDWCIQETLRLYPSVPTAIGRILEHDVQHEDYTFFKGTTVNANIWSIHHSSEYWGDDVEEFRPERFAKDQTPDTGSASALRYFAFAAGPRYCIGQNLAMVEMRAIVSRLIVEFNIHFCASSPDKIDCISPNMIHFIIKHPIELKFTEIRGCQTQKAPQQPL